MPPKRNQNRPRTKTQNKTVDAMSDCVLPQDIIASIFARLPVKSLVRFKCVCKPLFNLLTNPNFIKLHSRHFPQTPKTFSVQSHLLKCPILGIDPPKKLTLIDPSSLREIFVDACNGLICMGRPFYTNDIVLWNPATNSQKILPPSTLDFGGATTITMASLGFGCNADGDDFKVVRIFHFKGKKMRVGVEVYSSKSDSWRKIDIDVGFKFTVLEPKNHVIVKGNPYWLVECLDEKRIGEGTVDSYVLLGFDATHMVFKIVHLPNFDEMGGNSNCPFVDWEGSIGAPMCFKREDDALERIDVWVYDDGERKWRLNKSFGPIGVQADQCLDCSRAGKIVGGCIDGRLFMYDPNKDCAGVSEVKKRKGCSFQIFAYDESLAYVKGMKPVIVKKEDQEEKYKDIDGFFVASLHHKSSEIACYYALAS